MTGCAAPEETPPASLSEWGLFTDLAAHVPADDVVSYELISPLFSDHASKHRFVRIPDGTQITVGDDGRWSFPVGTVLVKTFGFAADQRDPTSPERFIETRLLVHESEGLWRPLVYVWNAEGTDAVLAPAGERVRVSFIDREGVHHDELSYRVPSHTQCGNCHGGTADVRPLGPRTENLDRLHDFGDGLGSVSQIDGFVSRGWLAERPPLRTPLVDPLGAEGTDEDRARAYLLSNCSHCHRADGFAFQSGLWLDLEDTDRLHRGVCKLPIATGEAATGGRDLVIVPGAPDESILMFRFESTEPGVRMPDLQSQLVHEPGRALLRRWIETMDDVACDER